MNYMKQVAQILGVNLEEEFGLKKGIYDIYRYKLSRIGLVCFSPSTESWNVGNKLLVNLLLGKDEIIKISEPILDDVEKRYLINVIKPFRDRVIYVVKRDDDIYEYIVIAYRCINGEEDYIYFPYFKKGIMYKGMELNKEYTMEDLGL